MSTVRLTIKVDEKGQAFIKEPLPLAPGEHEVFLVIRDLKEDEEIQWFREASSKVLEEIWDNEDDATYDDYIVRNRSAG